MDIKIDNINIRKLDIPDVTIFETSTYPEPRIPVAPPVVVDIGIPVVDMPGCVEAHERDNNNQLEIDDPKGVKIYCDAGTPSFNPMDYNKDELEFKYEAPVPPVNPPPDAPEVKPPEIPKKTNAAEVKCPTEAQELKEPVGTLVENGTKKIVEYRLVGKECIPVKEDIRIPDQIIQAIPTAGAITTTGGIAVVATTSALLAKPLADLVLKAVKPTVKKVIKKIAAIRGKSSPVESLKERRDQQRIRSHASRKLKGKE